MSPDESDDRQKLRTAIEQCGTLLYAEKQWVKSGEYRAVLEKLTVRHRIQMLVFGGSLLFMGGVYRDEMGWRLSPPVLMLAAVGLAGAVWFRYRSQRLSHARRLLRELESARRSGDGRETGGRHPDQHA